MYFHLKTRVGKIYKMQHVVIITGLVKVFTRLNRHSNRGGLREHIRCMLIELYMPNTRLNNWGSKTLPSLSFNKQFSSLEII